MRRQAWPQHIGDLLELELVGRGDLDLELLLRADRRVGAAQVGAVGELALGLVDGLLSNERGYDARRAVALLDQVRMLSGPDMEGRQSGTAGADRAAEAAALVPVSQIVEAPDFGGVGVGIPVEIASFRRPKVGEIERHRRESDASGGRPPRSLVQSTMSHATQR